jgi:threonine aldolase
MQLASKMRFIAAQFSALLEDHLWRTLATHANRMAQALASGLSNVPGLRIVQPVETNAVFIQLPEQPLAALQREFPFHRWSGSLDTGRLMTAFDTQPTDVDAFVSAAHRIVEQS